jgi:Family of unknown function (DUF5335)
MASETREIPHEEWQRWFEDFSREEPDYLATVEVLGGEIGAETEAARPRLTAITYDRKDNILVIGLDGTDDDAAEDLQHIVYGPRRILVAEGDGEISFEIEDQERTQTVVRLDPAG